jgi:hypothetical protein
LSGCGTLGPTIGDFVADGIPAQDFAGLVPHTVIRANPSNVAAGRPGAIGRPAVEVTGLGLRMRLVGGQIGHMVACHHSQAGRKRYGYQSRLASQGIDPISQISFRAREADHWGCLRAGRGLPSGLPLGIAKPEDPQDSWQR